MSSRNPELLSDERPDWMGAPTRSGHLIRLHRLAETTTNPRTLQAINKAIANVSAW